MASNVNIFDKYGIKEVANVYFEALDDDLAAGVYAGDIVLFLDTLKVSTIETTAENTAAQGGWGNPKLVQWDYGKEINITLEDALMSLESLRFMLGGAIKRVTDDSNTAKIIVHHTEEVVVNDEGKVPAPKDHITGITMKPAAIAGHPIKLINLTKGYRTQITEGTMAGLNIVTFTNPKAGITGVAPDKGDEPFQFIINKAKVQSNVTITLQAEGDPSTFEMTLNVLRDGNEMMKLVRYNVTGSSSGDDDKDVGSLTPVSSQGG